MTYYLTLLLCAQGSAPSSKFRQAGLMVGTDKVTTHAYETMYGIFLKQLSRRGAKLFEIGLGCNMGYGPGASMKLWANLLPHAEVHFAEYDGACVDKWVRRHSIRRNDTRIVVGDQANDADLERWIRETGGKFDAVVDDGGHTNMQIMNSFDALWPEVKPGGLYFIEDLQVGREPHYADHCGCVVAEMLSSWVQQLSIPETPGLGSSWSGHIYPMPLDVDFVLCQREACVIGKKPVATHLGIPQVRGALKRYCACAPPRRGAHWLWNKVRRAFSCVKGGLCSIYGAPMRGDAVLSRIFAVLSLAGCLYLLCRR